MSYIATNQTNSLAKMKSGSPSLMILSVAMSIAAASVWAQSPDYSEATIERIKPLYAEAEAAAAAKDHPKAFEAYLKMWNMSHIPELRYFAIMSAMKSIDFARVEKGKPLADDVKSIAERCPEPVGSADDSTIALQHLAFSAIQMALITHENNEHSFDAAATRLARSEVHLELAETLDRDSELATMNTMIRRLFREAKNTVTHNKGVQRYYDAVSVMRGLLRGGQSTQSASSRPATQGRREGGNASAKGAQSPEVARFTALYADGYHNFTCSRDANAGKGKTTPWLTLRAANGKEWEIRYKVDLLLNQNRGDGGLATDDRQDLTGVTLNVRFNKAGEPISIKNSANGNHCEVIDWKISGYGW